MPVQTTLRRFFFPDGCKVSIQEVTAGPWIDMGSIISTVTNTLEFDENIVQLANAADTEKQIKNMKVNGGFTLVHWNPENLAKLSGGIFTSVDTAGTPIATIPDQDISAGWADNTIYNLDMKVSSSDSSRVRTTAKPTITSVTLDPDGTPEVLVENTEYVIIDDPNSPTKWSIQFISANMSTGSPTTYPIRIDYGTNTPIANTTIYAGTSTQILSAVAMRMTHTDSNSRIRQVELFSVDTGTGSFQFNFKGANEEGLEEIPVTFSAKIDDSQTDGRQLIAFTVEDNAA